MIVSLIDPATGSLGAIIWAVVGVSSAEADDTFGLPMLTDLVGVGVLVIPEGVTVFILVGVGDLVGIGVVLGIIFWERDGVGVILTDGEGWGVSIIVG